MVRGDAWMSAHHLLEAAPHSLRMYCPSSGVGRGVGFKAAMDVPGMSLFKG